MAWNTKGFECDDQTALVTLQSVDSLLINKSSYFLKNTMIVIKTFYN